MPPAVSSRTGSWDQDDFRAGLVFQMVGNLLRQVVGVDDDLFNPGLLQLVNSAAEQCAPANLRQGFRDAVGQRAHAGAKPGGEDECFIRHGHGRSVT
jgi:hypothetical protein